MKRMFTKKGIYSLVAIVCIVTLIYIIFEVVTVKNLIQSPKQTALYDRDGHPIIPNHTQVVSAESVPSLINTYVSQEKDIPAMVYPEKGIRYWIAHVLISNYEEEELLELALNHLYFRNGIFGLENAANYYFNKEIDETTVEEQILLLSKLENTGVEDLLYERNLITKEIHTSYKNDLPQLLDQLHTSTTYAHSFVDHVIDEIEARYGVDEEEFFRRGYNVYTSLRRDVQNVLYEQFRNEENFPEPTRYAIAESGMVILDQKTGAIAGLIGGRNVHESSLNRATDITRQPASTFKPLISFAPAFEMGWKLGDELKDEPMRFGNFQPRNYDYEHRGVVTVEEALLHSYNVPSVWLLYKIGFENGLEMIKSFDLFTIHEEDGYKLGLGFTRVGTSPLALAQAYSIFTNEGSMVDAHAVLRIESEDGNTLYEPRLKEKKLVEKKTATIMNDLLVKVVESGTGAKAQIEGRRIGGKTGTTSYDAWFVGFDENYIGSIWIGPDQVAPRYKIDIAGGESAALLFQKIFSELQVTEDSRK
ncbi:transglycosylase domain-containing protein [Bacillus timonensis]|nr:transglycosylase domain-containing protein [Bacillus timonensis]